MQFHLKRDLEVQILWCQNMQIKLDVNEHQRLQCKAQQQHSSILLFRANLQIIKSEYVQNVASYESTNSTARQL